MCQIGLDSSNLTDLNNTNAWLTRQINNSTDETVTLYLRMAQQSVIDEIANINGA